MSDRPILFSTAMVRALLAGKKTQTRRLLLNKVGKPSGWEKVHPGDVMWVRETWDAPSGNGYVYRADFTDEEEERLRRQVPQLRPWRAAIHMPRAACRIKLGVEAVRIERLRDISEDDVLAEGVVPEGLEPPFLVCFAHAWDAIHGAGAWGRNPEVIPISFRVL